jgi:oligoribonuclease NrnB/cAMP/cGMP phosphodiesterase (DHH superfamily)
LVNISPSRGNQHFGVFMENNLDLFLEQQFAERDASTLVNILKRISHNDQNKSKNFTIPRFSRLAYEKYIKGNGELKILTKKENGKTIIYHFHSIKEVSQKPSEMVGKNGFITLDLQMIQTFGTLNTCLQV